MIFGTASRELDAVFTPDIGQKSEQVTQFGSFFKIEHLHAFGDTVFYDRFDLVPFLSLKRIYRVFHVFGISLFVGVLSARSGT